MTEPDVTLSDYAMALVCTAFAIALLRIPSQNRRAKGWLVVLFFSLAAAAALGGTEHGFFLDPASIGHRIIWPATLIAIGGAALSGWNLGASLIFSPRGIRVVGIGAGAGFVLYCGYVLAVSQAYLVAIVNYLPSAVFLLLSFGLLALRLRSQRVAYGVLGVILTFVAAGVQQAHISLHPVYLSHNALYHLIQTIGLLFIFLGGRAILAPRQSVT